MREKRPIIALDFPTYEAVAEFLAQFPKEEKLYLKIGMELFYAEGPQIVKQLKVQGHQIFLDLKLHDIPHTVESAMKVLAGLGVDMTNVHAAGGSEMMKAAKKGLIEGTPMGQPVPKLIAVTQLTSTSEAGMKKDQNIQTSIQSSVVHYAERVAFSGLDGVVCSAQEVGLIKQATNANFVCLTPGIRLKNKEQADQKRVMTPEEARAIGSDFIVVGRPITQAENPLQAYREIFESWNREV
ncbi:orotidine-5'-phosphate decarboxylase [Lactococcus sp.]|uniref:orotidine-5'-phosphate decarboxylase n=1 Tax=Lactococcus sp. TaxID=44273 RepID=UPI0035B0C422